MTSPFALRARWPHTGVILAGGQSRRMGRPKEGLPLPDGRPMIAQVIATLRAVCTRVLIVGECRGYAVTSQDDLLWLPDRHPGLGPLAGIETALASGLDDRYLIVACDQPLLTPALLRRLLGAAVPRICLFDVGDTARWHPFPGVYPAEWLPAVAEALRSGDRSLQHLLACAEITRVRARPAERARLGSLNSPDDLAALRDVALMGEV